MWVKNIRTGLNWEVSDELGKSLLKDEDYELANVEEPAQASEEFLALKKNTVAELLGQFGDKLPAEAKNLKKDELIAAILALPAE